MQEFRNVTKLLFVVLFAASTSGCFVFDEIDNAGKFQDPPGTPPRKNASAPAAKDGEVASARGAAKGGPAKSAVETAKNWWATATSLSSEENTEEVVTCKLGLRVEFSRREDCLVRGGTID